MAFLSKEEVVALPLILTLWLLISGSSVKRSLGLWVALAIYFVLREYAGAVGISNAPPYYRFNFDPVHVATNIVEYADRSMTLGVLVLIATAIALKRLPAPTSREWRLVWMGSVWLDRRIRRHHLAPSAIEPVRCVPQRRVGPRGWDVTGGHGAQRRTAASLARRNRWSDSAVSAAANLLATECAMDRTAQPECCHDAGDPVG